MYFSRGNKLYVSGKQETIYKMTKEKGWFRHKKTASLMGWWLYCVLPDGRSFLV